MTKTAFSGEKGPPLSGSVKSIAIILTQTFFHVTQITVTGKNLHQFVQNTHRIRQYLQIEHIKDTLQLSYTAGLGLWLQRLQGDRGGL